jgi:hypothetical protein
MSLFSWLNPPKKPAAPQPESSGLSRMEPTRPVGKRQAVPNGQPANRKGERMARRELLYAVVREAMGRAGVLSASYKFKVLSLDSRGRQFLVMVDVARDHVDDAGRLAEIETLIAQAAKSRHDIVVTAVYWRASDYVAVGDVRAQQRASDSQPAPLEAPPAAPTSNSAPPAAAPAHRSARETIQADEVDAFKRALAAGVANPAAAAAAAVGVAHGASARAFDGSAVHGPQSYTLLTGFEDTEMADGDHRMPVLSGTQYGDLN